MNKILGISLLLPSMAWACIGDYQFSERTQRKVYTNSFKIPLVQLNKNNYPKTVVMNNSAAELSFFYDISYNTVWGGQYASVANILNLSGYFSNTIPGRNPTDKAGAVLPANTIGTIQNLYQGSEEVYANITLSWESTQCLDKSPMTAVLEKSTSENGIEYRKPINSGRPF